MIASAEAKKLHRDSFKAAWAQHLVDRRKGDDRRVITAGLGFTTDKEMLAFADRRQGERRFTTEPIETTEVLS